MLTRHHRIVVSPASTMKENPLQYRVRGTPVPTTRTRGTNYPESTPYHRGTERCLAQSSFPAAFGGCVKPLVRGWTPLLPKNNCGDRGGREGAGTTGAHLWVAASPLAPRGGLSGARTSRWPGRRSVVPVRGFAQRYDCGGFTGGEATSPLRTTAGACARREVSGGSRH